MPAPHQLNAMPCLRPHILSLLIFLLGLCHRGSAVCTAFGCGVSTFLEGDGPASVSECCSASPLSGAGMFLPDQDSFFSGLDTRVNTYERQQIYNTSEPELFFRDREGQIIEFEVSLPSGWYTVSLYFAELDRWHQESGRRVFDVAMQGQPILPRLDIFNISGGANAAYTASLPVVVNSSNLLHLRLAAVVGKAKVNAIRVEPLVHDGELETLPEPKEKTLGQLVWARVGSWWHTSWCKWFIHFVPLVVKEVWLAVAAIPGEPRIIVSLTTSPKRIAEIAPVIAALKRGSLQPALFIINLPFVFLRDGSTFDEIPAFLLTDPLVKINHCEDVGPATKILGAIPLVDDPDALILTVDDDVVYPRNHLKKMYLKSLEFPEAVITAKSDLPGYMLEGYSGVLYRLRFFDEYLKLIKQVKALPRYCYLVDDFILSNYILNKGLQIVRCYTGYEGRILRQLGRGIVILDHGLRSDALRHGADMTSIGNQDNYKACRRYLESEGTLFPGYPLHFPYRQYSLKRPNETTSTKLA